MVTQKFFTLNYTLTSTGISEFCPAEEAEVACSSPDSLCVSKAESGTKMI